MSKYTGQAKTINLSRESSEPWFYVSFPFNQELVDSVKRTLFGRRWDSVNRRWKIPANNTTAGQVAAFAAKYGFTLTEQAKQWIDSCQEANRDPMSGFAQIGRSLAIPGLGGTLRSYQKTAVAYALAKKRLIIADEMGIGKTIEALATIQSANAFPALIICPSVVKVNWSREISKWLPGKSVKIIQGKTPTQSLIPGDIVIVNYDIVSAWQPVLEHIRFNAIILDEAHYIKDRKAKRTKSVIALAKGKAIRIALTGTPIVNRPAELISQLEALDLLGSFGGFCTFAERYCDGHKKYGYWDVSGASNLDELHQQLMMAGYIRRTKKDVLAELVPLQRSLILVDSSSRKRYEAVQEHLYALLRDKAAVRDVSNAVGESDTWEETLPLKATKSSKRPGAQILANLAQLRIETAFMKLPSLVQWAEDFLETGQKVVIFAYHHDVIETLTERLGSQWQTCCITGKTDPDERQRLIDQFQNDPQMRVMVANIRAVGVGVSLTAANTILFAELDWTSAAHDQAEARSHRSGQTSQVSAYYLLAEHTIDEDMYELISQKRLIIDQATNGFASNGGTSVVKELIDRLANLVPANLEEPKPVS